MAPGLETIGAGSGEKGTQAPGESAGAKHEMERYIAWYQDMQKRQPENDAAIDQQKAVIYEEIKALEEQAAQAEQAGQSTSGIVSEINKRSKGNTRASSSRTFPSPLYSRIKIVPIQLLP